MKIKSYLSSTFSSECVRFIVVGGMAVLLDGLFYMLLTKANYADPMWAKRISFGCGACWAFGMNKFYTFRKKEIKASEPLLFASVYLTGWALNSWSHDFILERTSLKFVAFLTATALSTINNYIGLKVIVFRKLK